MKSRTTETRWRRRNITSPTARCIGQFRNVKCSIHLAIQQRFAPPLATHGPVLPALARFADSHRGAHAQIPAAGQSKCSVLVTCAGSFANYQTDQAKKKRKVT